MKENTWLDDRGREAVLQKLSSLHGQFLTWPNFWNLTYVATLLDDVRVDPEYFFGNVIRRYQQLRTVPMNFRYYQLEDKKWAYPFVVNAFYVLTMNTISKTCAYLKSKRPPTITQEATDRSSLKIKSPCRRSFFHDSHFHPWRRFFYPFQQTFLEHHSFTPCRKGFSAIEIPTMILQS